MYGGLIWDKRTSYYLVLFLSLDLSVYEHEQLVNVSMLLVCTVLYFSQIFV